VDLNNRLLGRLDWISASLLFFLSNEVLKWQFPVHAAGEKLAILAGALRSALWPASLHTTRR
jgi:hypothetical protein